MLALFTALKLLLIYHGPFGRIEERWEQNTTLREDLTENDKSWHAALGETSAIRTLYFFDKLVLFMTKANWHNITTVRDDVTDILIWKSLLKQF